MKHAYFFLLAALPALIQCHVRPGQTTPITPPVVTAVDTVPLPPAPVVAVVPPAPPAIVPETVGIVPALPVFQLVSEVGRSWVDSVFATMSEEQRIGQLLMIRAHSDKDEAYWKGVEDLIRQYEVGGLCFFQGTPEKQAELTNRYQAASRVPLLVSMDAEWGLSMRLANWSPGLVRLSETNIVFPKQMMLGAVQDDRLIYDFGQEMARECRRLGVHISFSPDADVNNNAANPVINDRSFGENRENVARKSLQYMYGLQDGRVLACAKHFPGHGDTNTDSHFDLPVISHSARRLDSLELYPFRALVAAGVGSFMVAHLNIPALDSQPGQPSTTSRRIITDLLRQKMGFNGLIFTDAMEMQAMTNRYGPGLADVATLRAGNDVVLLPASVPLALRSIKAALADGSYARDQFEMSVKRVLFAKYRLGITLPQRVDTTNLRNDLNATSAKLLKRNLVRNALTLVRDRDTLVGFTDLVNPADRCDTAAQYKTNPIAFATLAIGDTSLTIFQQNCALYAPMAHYNMGKDPDSLAQNRVLDQLRQYKVVLLSMHGTRSKAKDNFGLTPNQLQLVRRLNAQNRVVMTYFGNPYALQYFDEMPALLLAYTEDAIAQEIAAQALFGASDITGHLPVTVSLAAKEGQGVARLFSQKRLATDLPESVGLNSDTLALMNQIVAELIRTGAAPGCQILVAKNGKVVWNKAYGHFTYDSTQLVTTQSMYDLASITKVAATTISTMKMTEMGKINVNNPMSVYVPELTNTNKRDLLVNEIIAHHAGLQPWIPFYESTLNAQKQPKTDLYRPAETPGFTIPVAPYLWMKDRYVDTIWQTIFTSNLLPSKAYKYSDLSMYLMARAIKNQSGQPLEVFAAEQFYQPLGLSATYNPWKKGWVGLCPPTEQDDYFRYERIQGYVHDMGAAMLGGVSGHAGLFSNANDLAKIFQMLLNGGSYGGHTYLHPETIAEFTTLFPRSTRRGLGFDMKERDPKATANMSTLAGLHTFGHAGFTGNVVWADPDNQLIFIFLSNRTFPTMKNNKLINGDYRPKLQSVVYRALK